MDKNNYIWYKFYSLRYKVHEDGLKGEEVMLSDSHSSFRLYEMKMYLSVDTGQG